jgi:hypothetical protein
MKKKLQHIFLLCMSVFTFFSFVKVKENQFGEILSLISWINPHLACVNQHVFFISKFSNLVIIVGKKMEEIIQIEEKIQTTKTLPKKNGIN